MVTNILYGEGRKLPKDAFHKGRVARVAPRNYQHQGKSSDRVKTFVQDEDTEIQ